jgi:serine/threonine protein kinase
VANRRRAAGGRYILGELLGRGGMAEVFAGRALGSLGFQKPVAIKRLLPSLAQDEEFVGRLVDEAKLLVGLSHANVISVLDLVRESDDVFLVMEFVDGPSLRQLLGAHASTNRGPLPLPLVAYIVQAACAGLEYAHARPTGAIIHADVSPSNLLLTTTGEVKVADFGIARREGIATAVEGKWAYMPPEQAAARRCRTRATSSRSACASTSCSPASTRSRVGSPSTAATRPRCPRCGARASCAPRSRRRSRRRACARWRPTRRSASRGWRNSPTRCPRCGSRWAGATARPSWPR